MMTECEEQLAKAMRNPDAASPVMQRRLNPSVWKAAQELYESPDIYVTDQQIATKLGVRREAVTLRARRNKWVRHVIHATRRIQSQAVQEAHTQVTSQTRQIANQAIGYALQAVTPAVTKDIQDAIADTIANATKGMKRYAKLIDEASDPASLRELTISLKNLDDVRRRSLGLSDEPRQAKGWARSQPIIDAVEVSKPAK